MVVGAFGSGLTIGQWARDAFMSSTQYKHVMRVGEDYDQNMNGWMPQAIYYGNGGELARGGWNSIWMEHGERKEDTFGDDSRRMTKIELHGSSWSVCSVYSEFHESDGTAPIVIAGEVLRECGAPWYASQVSERFNGVWEPRDCAWIDQCDDAWDQDACRWEAWGGYWMDDLDYFRNIRDGGGGNPDEACSKIHRFEVNWRKRELDGAASSSGSDRVNGTSPWGRLPHDVIYTKRPLALRLCDSDTSRGQSVVSTAEGLFCDMTEHVLYPICQSGMIDSCFDVETDDLRSASSGDALESRAVNVKHFNPSSTSLDADDESEHHVKRSRAADSLVGNGRTHFFSADDEDSECLTADQIDGDNYTGPVTASPAPFARISNGIIVNPSSEADSQVILNCPADYSPKKRYIRGRPVA